VVAKPTLSSGEIRTKYNMFRYGRYEFRVKPPDRRRGTFLASAFIFRSPKWQDWREVDIELEEISGNVVQSNIIYGDNQPKYDPSFADNEETPVAVDTQDGFHLFVIEWLPRQVSFYVDPERNPKPIRRYKPGMKLSIPDKPGKVMMNLWTWKQVDKNSYPMVYQIDYVRFYKADLEPGDYPCASVPDCLDPSDRDYSKNNERDGIPPTPSGYAAAASAREAPEALPTGTLRK
jgi:beta-glucanase (GH16 family)